MSVRVSLVGSASPRRDALSFDLSTELALNHNPLRLTRSTRESHAMNYPLLPADAAAYAWQLSCCLVTLLFAMFSWMVGPR